MTQLTLKDLAEFIQLCKENNVPLDTPVYLGDDDELNGIHCAWYVNIVENNEGNEDEEYLMSMINDRAGNNTAKDINILIS